MNIKRINLKFFYSSLSLLILLAVTKVSAKQIKVLVRLQDQTLVLNDAVDLHLTDAEMPIKNSMVNIKSTEAWLFFDNLRPSDVLEKYAKSILVNGSPLSIIPGGNCRIAIYKQGAVIIPQNDKYQPLEAFTDQNFNGTVAKYSLYNYYSNGPSTDIPSSLLQPLAQDNSIRSFKLKRGYMVTFADEPDGLGYSRIFIADSADLTVSVLPVELDKRISYIRVFRWQWPSKKGWAGVRGGTVASNGMNKQDLELLLTQSTWFYSWGAHDSSPVNAEFVAMKWGLGSSFNEINSRTDITHLLGYNEPNRPDQSNMSVTQALKEWPQLLKSGLRLGSPSVSDNSRLDDWLYRFLDECKKRNYRVDYVTVHAYWGSEQMPTAQDWYDKLKEIHLKTGRPLWVTEWNNGANWTKEPWPAGTAEQQAKQVRELRQIIQVLDTASFVERYSIYNWVENKRAVIIDSFNYKTVNGKSITDQLLKQQITPAGEFYRDNKPGFAFNSKNELVPTWETNGVPSLSYRLSGTKDIRLQWTMDSSPEMINGFVVEQSSDDNIFKVINQIAQGQNAVFLAPLKSSVGLTSQSVYYRIHAIDLHGNELPASNVVSYSYVKNKISSATVGNLTTPTSWSLYPFEHAYLKLPVIVFGTPTNRNKTPQTQRIKDLGETSFEFKLDTWNYLKNPVFKNTDTVGYMALPDTGTYNFKGIIALAGNVSNVNSDWTKVNFTVPFKEVPVVFATQVSSRCDSTTSVRIRNVTSLGFEVELQYEGAIKPPKNRENIDYVALTPGKGLINGKKIEVGRTTDAAAGDFFGFARIDFGEQYSKPAFFGAMQTESDGIASALRIKGRGADFTEVFKEKETSKSSDVVTKETVGWMVMETAE